MKNKILLIIFMILLLNAGCKKSEDNSNRAFVYPNSFAPISTDKHGPYFSEWRPLGPIQGSGLIWESCLMKIYTKNEKLLFESDSIFESWDGKVNDVICPHDYYYFVVTYETLDGLKHKDTGMFQLIK